jgi:PBP1b-binding outer membrane lipoprotein LpoB
MKKIILLAVIAISLSSCSNPYINPQTAKAVSEEEQVELLKQQVELQKEQNVQLKRIADALEKK